ncbi:MAG: DUF6573 family protein [Vicinamibacterales bacterium]
MFENADLISVYTRAQAIEDGVLVDVSEWARACGFKLPVAVTRAVWDRCIEVPKSRKRIESEHARARDVLFVLFMCIRRTPNTDRINYQIRCSVKEGRRIVRLKALLGAGDDGRPVVTILLPEED